MDAFIFEINNLRTYNKKLRDFNKEINCLNKALIKENKDLLNFQSNIIKKLNDTSLENLFKISNKNRINKLNGFNNNNYSFDKNNVNNTLDSSKIYSKTLPNININNESNLKSNSIFNKFKTIEDINNNIEYKTLNKYSIKDNKIEYLFNSLKNEINKSLYNLNKDLNITPNKRNKICQVINFNLLNKKDIYENNINSNLITKKNLIKTELNSVINILNNKTQHNNFNLDNNYYNSKDIKKIDTFVKECRILLNTNYYNEIILNLNLINYNDLNTKIYEDYISTNYDKNKYSNIENIFKILNNNNYLKEKFIKLFI